MAKTYSLPPLPYTYNALEPHISEKTMTLHHTKHHQAYVNGANAALEKLDKSRKGEMQIDIRAVLRDFSFNYDGHVLHSIFWPNLAPAGKGGGKPGGKLADAINRDFGGFDKFRAQFTDAGKTIEGVGWALLLYDPLTESLVLTQIEKQNLMHLSGATILLGLDAWEHAYLYDVGPDRPKYIENWWNVVNWSDVDFRLGKVAK
ncbi:MAG: superoxide dismutase [Thaumarchaeota archaeon]|nr:superoxide dismutase [Nitrososphaerota archaeon]